MVKKCDITGTGVMSGNSVSHANNHNRRRFMPNLQVVSLFSEALNKVFKLKICSKTLRSIEHNGGLDSYLESTSGIIESHKKHFRERPSIKIELIICLISSAITFVSLLIE